MACEEAVEAFAEQRPALVGSGANVIWIGPCDLEEMRAAVEGVRQISEAIPIITTMTFDTRGRTMMGVTPERAVDALASFKPVAVGGNCGNGPEEIIGVIEKMHGVSPQALLVAKANAGVPEWSGGQAVYCGPAHHGRYAARYMKAGARIIGACCAAPCAHPPRETRDVER
jgi:5-methyltetrahydrofolate--homocysteine methyltransferase